MPESLQRSVAATARGSQDASAADAGRSALAAALGEQLGRLGRSFESLLLPRRGEPT